MSLLSLLASLSFGAELDAAYQKEFAYLKAEKQSLQKATTEFEASAAKERKAAESQTESLQGRLIYMTLQADKAEEQLSQAERESFSAEEDADRVGALLMQARTSLEGVELPEEVEGAEAEAEALRAVFSAAAVRIEQGGQVRVESGAWFDKGGEEVQGQLVRVGNIASYGVAGPQSGALAPAGEDRLQLWPQDASGAAQSFGAGEVPQTLPIFLYESLAKRITEQPAKTFGQVMEGGGIVGWIIMGLGVVAFLIAGLRLLLLRSAGDPTTLSDAVCKALDGGDLAGALKAAQADNAAGRVAQAVLAARGLQRAQIEDLASEAVLRETPRLERMGPAILVIAAVAPLLGLLGTVTGMIATFDIITEFGTGDPKMLSGGISTALITTQLGLVVAIPAVLLGNAIGGKTEAVLSALDQAALAMVNAVDSKEGRLAS
ncbi:MAG: MotA/TolQ/ExbB proton channel family protein [Myxococcota bacterium]|nr:MotA/TolQ/ExbB proton channel family protein [Myxococcota bacterium]